MHTVLTELTVHEASVCRSIHNPTPPVAYSCEGAVDAGYRCRISMC